ncbi:hypothetical protein HDU67_009500 [Dinochytrium kinnereticum]|nr:hypothetical protein HDU67_009500 [Dinochytrium kinnereticum]
MSTAAPSASASAAASDALPSTTTRNAVSSSLTSLTSLLAPPSPLPSQPPPPQPQPSNAPAAAATSSQSIIIGAAVGGGVIFLVIIMLMIIMIRRTCYPPDLSSHPQSQMMDDDPQPDMNNSTLHGHRHGEGHAEDAGRGYGYALPNVSENMDSHDSTDAPTAAAIAAGLIPPSSMPNPYASATGSPQITHQLSLSRSVAGGSIRSPSTLPSATVISPSSADPYRPPSTLRNRSHSFSANQYASPIRPSSSLSGNQRRPSLPGGGISSEPYQNIELISAYKDSDLAEKAFELQRAHSMARQLSLPSNSIMMTPGASPSAAGSIPMSSRRPSISSVTTTGSLAGAFADRDDQTSGPDLDTFSIPAESFRWVFARRSSYGGGGGNSAAPEAVYAHLAGGSATVPGGGWGVATECGGVFKGVGGGQVTASVASSAASVASSSLMIHTAGLGYVGPSPSAPLTASATIDPSTGRVVLMDTQPHLTQTQLGGGSASSLIDVPTSPMMDLLNDQNFPAPTNAPTPVAPSVGEGGGGAASSSGGSSLGSLPRRPPHFTSKFTTATSSLRRPPPHRSARDQIALLMSWKEAAISSAAPPVDSTLPRLRPNPLRVAVASGERQHAWPAFVQQLVTVLTGLADLEDTNNGTLSPALNESLQELCVTVTSMIRTSTAIPARIGYEPRAVNEIAMRRHDVVHLFHRFDEDFGFGLNRDTGVMGFVNLGHLDPRRLAVAVEPAPVPIPVPALPVQFRGRNGVAAAASPVPSLVLGRRPSGGESVTSVMAKLDRAPSTGSAAARYRQHHSQSLSSSTPPTNSSPYHHFTPPPPSAALMPYTSSSPSAALMPYTSSSPSSLGRTTTAASSGRRSVSNLLEMLDQSAVLVVGGGAGRGGGEGEGGGMPGVRSPGGSLPRGGSAGGW